MPQAAFTAPVPLLLVGENYPYLEDVAVALHDCRYPRFVVQRLFCLPALLGEENADNALTEVTAALHTYRPELVLVDATGLPRGLATALQRLTMLLAGRQPVVLFHHSEDILHVNTVDVVYNLVLSGLDAAVVCDLEALRRCNLPLVYRLVALLAKQQRQPPDVVDACLSDTRAQLRAVRRALGVWNE